jgi:hypothetical protein
MALTVVRKERLFYVIASVAWQSQGEKRHAKFAIASSFLLAMTNPFFYLSNVSKYCNNEYSSGYNTSRALLPSNGPTIPADSS